VGGRRLERIPFALSIVEGLLRAADQRAGVGEEGSTDVWGLGSGVAAGKPWWSGIIEKVIVEKSRMLRQAQHERKNHQRARPFLTFVTSINSLQEGPKVLEG